MAADVVTAPTFGGNQDANILENGSEAPMKYRKNFDIKRASDLAYIQGLIRNSPVNKVKSKFN